MATNDGKNRGENKKCLKIILENLLLILSMIGVILGFIIGFTIRPLDPSPDALLWIGLPGELYLRMLKMMIIPLIASSVIAGQDVVVASDMEGTLKGAELQTQDICIDMIRTGRGSDQ